MRPIFVEQVSFCPIQNIGGQKAFLGEVTGGPVMPNWHRSLAQQHCHRIIVLTEWSVCIQVCGRSCLWCCRGDWVHCILLCCCCDRGEGEKTVSASTVQWSIGFCFFLPQLRPLIDMRAQLLDQNRAVCHIWSSRLVLRSLRSLRVLWQESVMAHPRYRCPN